MTLERPQPQIEALLSRRVPGELGHRFGGFGNMYYVTSSINGHGVALSSDSEAVDDTELCGVFASSYQPTLREFLDAIALQTRSSWTYSGKRGYANMQMALEEIERWRRDPSGMNRSSGWHFSRLARAAPKPFQVDLLDGWKGTDHEYRVEYDRTGRAGGFFDIALMGSYSTDESDTRPFFDGIRKDVALDSIQSFGEEIEASALLPAKVGPYDALAYQLTAGSTIGRDMIYRIRVLIVGNRCFRVVIGTLPDNDAEVMPKIDTMLRSFRVTRD